MSRFTEAKKIYEKYGIDVESALEKLAEIPVSIHCWQGDDVVGFESSTALSGGIQTTGNYPGKATTANELMADIDKMLSLVPGKKRLNLHAIYAITDEKVERDQLEPKHFKAWVDFAKQRNLGIDFNPTFFSHPKASGLTLSSANEEIRAYWVRHGICCRKIAEYIGRELKSPCLFNVWIPDGLKEIPADRLGPRIRLKKSLDEIFAEKIDKKYVIDAVESKVFGIGLEAYTVGSNEFYQNYASKAGICCLLDNGHYHPTEMVSDKIPALLCFNDYVALHVTRPMRWDSDHVVLLDDELKEIAKEIVRNDATERVKIGLDYFDASINRISAWVVGARNMLKALLYALLSPNAKLKQLQDAENFTEMMALSEEVKMLPLGDVWEEFLLRQNVDGGMKWFDEVKKYEQQVLSKR